MTSLAVVIDTSAFEAVAKNIARIDAGSIGRAAMRGVNEAAVYVREESIRRILSGVNLTQAYVEERLELDLANDGFSPEAVIVAPRSGGKRRPGIQPVNLRQYAAVQLQAPVRFSNNDPRIARNEWAKNPRANSKWLRWKKRTGNPALGIPVGMKQSGVSVEVKQGSRKNLGPNAFIQTMPNGQTLVMERRTSGPGSGKGKIRALYSLSVWQMFRKARSAVIPLAEVRLRQTVGDEVVSAVNKVLK